MNQKTLDEMYAFFENHVKGFQFTEKDRELMRSIKYEHTMRVTKLCVEIGKSVFDKEEEIMLCQIIGLFHDIGRWKQYFVYRKFLDYETEDHAKLSVDVLIENNVLESFDEYHRKIILDSIFEHNKIAIKNINDGYILKFAKIIRDADKIDNYIVEYDNFDSKDKNKRIEAIFPESSGISDEVYEAIRKRELVDSRFRRNNNDFKFAKLAWIFDMNFPKSFQIVKENQYVDKFYNNIKHADSRMIELYKLIKDFVDEK